ncbi:hypothetical protein CBM2589_A10187 [Cupriavidus taiwanensis]|uniref:Uncharacterized protein n=1 Tax=Cupriavidus taiwanensis TaxID=164546 RepID=A0A375BYN4_9BURK|nr:hypothetical protein CBM2589_A10187 [Cupriavidus taiwanensis]
MASPLLIPVQCVGQEANAGQPEQSNELD